LHGRLDLPNLETSFDQSFADAPMISVSDAQRVPLPQARWTGTVYHGILEDLFVPNLAPEGYLAFLGRIAPEKGPEAAIQLAGAAGLPLKIAAKVDKADREYFMERVQPLIDGDQIQHIGEIDERQK
jgi:glycosyltransferase involved in cell wall biosynthesis